MYILMEYLTMFVLLAFILVQILIPSLFGRPVFPMFRREKQLKEVVSELEQQKHEREIAEKLKTLSKEINQYDNS